MPPFGNLYNMKVLMDANLLADERIVFNAGTHRDVVHLRQEDYRRLVRPEVVHLTREVMTGPAGKSRQETHASRTAGWIVRVQPVWTDTVKPTVDGIRDGRDEVLEAALREILGGSVPQAEIETIARAGRK